MGQSEQLELALKTHSTQGDVQKPACSSSSTVTIYTDGASKGNPGLAAIGVVIYQEGRLVKQIAEVIGETTNNVAEYRALIAGLEYVLALGITRVRVLSDSQLLVHQVLGTYKVKSRQLFPLFETVGALIERLDAFELQHIGRVHNAQADGLANRAIKAHLKRIEKKGPKQTG